MKTQQPKPTETSTPTTLKNIPSILHYSVPVKWVEVTIEIRADLAAWFDLQPDGVRNNQADTISTFAIVIEIFSGRGKLTPTETVATYFYRPAERSCWLRAMAQNAEDRKTLPRTFHMKAHKWQNVRNAAQYLGTDTTTLVHTALELRKMQVERYNRSNGKK